MSTPAPTTRCQWGSCSAMFDSEEALYEHLSSTEHYAQRPGHRFECRWADCRVTTGAAPKSVKRHIITHSKWKPHPCAADGCTKRFQRSEDLTRHLAKVHSRVLTAAAAPARRASAAAQAAPPELEGAGGAEPRVVRCRWNGCERVLNTPELLVAHLRADHPSSDGKCLWYGCQPTRKIFPPQNFARHMQKHLPAWHRPFACDCRRTFVDSGSLKNHRRKSHCKRTLARADDGAPPSKKAKRGSSFDPDSGKKTTAPHRASSDKGIDPDLDSDMLTEPEAVTAPHLARHSTWPREPSFAPDKDEVSGVQQLPESGLRAAEQRVDAVLLRLRAQEQRLDVGRSRLRILGQRIDVLERRVAAAAALAATGTQQPQRETDDDDAISTVDMDGLQRRDWDMVNGNL